MKRLVLMAALMFLGATVSLASTHQESVQVPVQADLVLSGTLHLPTAEGTVPADVLYPGSQGSRHRPGLAEYLAANGIAALDLNKRGVEGSGGTWRDEMIERQAGDALAALRVLQNRPEVDRRRVGTVGHSHPLCAAPWHEATLAGQAA